MLSFIVRRLLIAIPLVLLSSVLVFLLVANSGDPLAELKGRNPPVPEATIRPVSTSSAWTSRCPSATRPGSATSSKETWASPSAGSRSGRCCGSA